jgi:transcriptional regulator with XRE-family HTH domain
MQGKTNSKIYNLIPMDNHGLQLKEIAKAQGFNIQTLADKIGVTRQTVEIDFKAKKLNRRILTKYVSALGINLDSFFGGDAEQPQRIDTKTEVQLLRELVAEQRKRLDLQDQMIRFFPKAVQMA